MPILFQISIVRKAIALSPFVQVFFVQFESGDPEQCDYPFPDNERFAFNRIPGDPGRVTPQNLGSLVTTSKALVTSSFLLLLVRHLLLEAMHLFLVASCY